MLKDKLRRLFDLQMFNDGGEPNPEGGEPNPEGDDPKGGEPNPEGGEKKPFATFPDEASFMARLKREAKKMSESQHKDFLKSLGVESAESLQTILADYNKRVEGEKSELEKAQEKANKLEKANGELLAKLTTDIKVSTVKSIASELGVDSNRLGRFMKLVDLDLVKVEDGSVLDMETVKESLSEILDEFPEFKGIESKGKSGKDDFAGKNGDKPKLTMEDVKKMSTKEVQENWEEIQKLLGK